MCTFRSLIIVVSLLSMLLNWGQGDISSKCGLDASSHRILTTEGQIPPSLPQLRLVQVKNVNAKTSLVVAVSPKHSQMPVYYISQDRGSKWQQLKPVISDEFTNIPLRHGPDLLMIASTPSPVTLYRFKSKTNCIESISRNHGKSWTRISSTFNNSNSVIKCFPNGAYGERGERIYVYVHEKQSKDMWVSNDYGRRFTFITSEVFYVVESLADSRVMYGMGEEILKASHDGGKNWERLESSRPILAPVFRNSDGTLSTWDADGRGTADGYPFPLEQIQTHPQNSGIFYVLTPKGLYRSVDGGKSYVILPIQSDKYLGIDRIAADPVNEGRVYAQCNMNSLYRSEDYGCSWTKLNVPLQ